MLNIIAHKFLDFKVVVFPEWHVRARNSWPMYSRFMVKRRERQKLSKWILNLTKTTYLDTISIMFSVAVWGHFVNQIRQKEQRGQNKDLFVLFLRTHFWPSSAQKRRFRPCFEKEQKNKGHLRFSPAAWSFLLLPPRP